MSMYVFELTFRAEFLSPSLPLSHSFQLLTSVHTMMIVKWIEYVLPSTRQKYTNNNCDCECVNVEQLKLHLNYMRNNFVILPQICKVNFGLPVYGVKLHVAHVLQAGRQAGSRSWYPQWSVPIKVNARIQFLSYSAMANYVL